MLNWKINLFHFIDPLALGNYYFIEWENGREKERINFCLNEKNTNLKSRRLKQNVKIAGCLPIKYCKNFDR